VKHCRLSRGADEGSTDIGVAGGNPADMVVLDCTTATDAVREPAPPLFGVKRGRRTFTRAPAEFHKPGK
jgi:cytosine deaminase